MYRAQVEVVLTMEGNNRQVIKRKDLNFAVQVNNPSGIKQAAIEQFAGAHAEYVVRTVSLTGRTSAILYCKPQAANRTGRELAEKGFQYKRLRRSTR
jgi:hypothetical protein